MKAFLAFFKKEMLGQLRSGKLFFLGILFVLFGIMNPALAKLTPWILEAFADSLAESGMTVTAVSVSAMDSWVQFFKNIPMALIAFVLLESGIFTGEYASGTLLLSLTKGLSRYKVVLAKTVALLLLWTLGFWACFGITYGYNAYFWDNSVAQGLLFSAFSWWLFGVLTVALMVFFSTVGSTSAAVLLGTGGVIVGCLLFGLIPPVARALPTMLTDGNSLIYGIKTAEDYLTALAVTAALCLVCFAVSVPIFNKKQL